MPVLIVSSVANAQPIPTSTQTSTVVVPEAPEVPVPEKIRLHPDDPAADRTGTPPKPPQEVTVPPPSAEPGVKRPVPDYDNRPPEAVTAGDVLIWVPRITFLPAHLVLEYGLRWPVIKAITFAEKEKVFKRVERIFTFRDGKSGIFPTALIDFGLSPSVGFYSFHNDVGYEGHTITLQGGFWVDNWKHLAIGDRWRVFSGDGELYFRGDFLTRPDDPFYGVGYASQYEDRGNLRFQRLDAEMGLSSYLHSDTLNEAGIHFRFRDGLLRNGEEPTFTSRFDPDQFNGFRGDGYQLLSVGVRGAFDTRDRDTEYGGGTGLRLDYFGGYNFSPGESDVSFLRFGGEGSVFYDFSGRNHVLGFSVYADLIEKFGDAPLPVSELIQLGGNEHLRGFLYGRFRGESAFVATASYRYPIWILLDANIFAGVGNTFGPNFEDFGWKRLVFNTGLALRTSLSRDTSIDLLIAVGTNRFEEDFEVDNVRFTLGANHGF